MTTQAVRDAYARSGQHDPRALNAISHIIGEHIDEFVPLTTRDGVAVLVLEALQAQSAVVAESRAIIKSLIEQPTHRFDVRQWAPPPPKTVVDRDGNVWTEDGGTWKSPTSPESPLATLVDIQIVAGPIVPAAVRS